MKKVLTPRLFSSLLKMMVFALVLLNSGFVSGQSKGRKFDLFGDKLPSRASWSTEKEFDRKGGPGESEFYIYVNSRDSAAEMTGLNIPIRENPGPGQYRYITFKWIKWGGDQIGLRLDNKYSGTGKRIGERYNYTYLAGDGTDIKRGLKVGENTPGHWTVVTRDLWKDFGEFTLTGLSMVCPSRRDAGFDGIILGTTVDVFEDSPGIIPIEVMSPEEIEGEDMVLSADSVTAEVQEEPQGVSIDWAEQLKAGGFMMYPLYLIAFIMIVITIQRLLTAREVRLAPRKLRKEVNEKLLEGDFEGAIQSCDKYRSTLGEALRFIFKHRKAGMEVVSQTAGDIAARDIRDHLARIYPLSVISSLSPLLGLLGTIVGMIEAFGLVALYGDEGGAAILSDSISKALITTAAGLIIAAPAVAIYFILKKRIMKLASIVEVEVENVITQIYLNEDSSDFIAAEKKETTHEDIV